MSKAKAATNINHRSAITGRFVKETYARTHPSTTTTERNPRPGPVTKNKPSR